MLLERGRVSYFAERRVETQTDPEASREARGTEPVEESTRSSRDEPSLQRGEPVGDFRVERFLGRGGMGEVFLARDAVLGRKVVLKLVHAKLVRSEAARSRLLQEARTTAKFSHPHIVSIYAAGEHRGVPYVALEYVDGQSLAERLRERVPSQREALRATLAVAEALHEAHSHGVLHRDIKPANVVVGKDGRLRVLDFGLAQQLGSVGAGESPGGGTPGYMAPEQWRDEDATSAVDIWAAGVMLYELLGGKLPYDDMSVLRIRTAVCSDEAAPRIRDVAEVADDLDALVASCLSKDPTARPSASGLRDALQGLLGSETRRPGEIRSPFRGLRAFGREHAQSFFGREAEIELVLERLREEPTLVVAGASGAGKSSLVAAGVIPRMREREQLLVLELRPTDRPFSALAARLIRGDTFPSGVREAQPTPDRIRDLAESLRATPGRLGTELRRLADEQGRSIVLFVDQLEEVVTLVPDPEVRARFIEALTLAADDPLDPVRVILAARDDFLGRLASASPRVDLHHVLILTQPDRAALRRTLEGPLSAIGHAFEDDSLADEMVAEVVGERASLPLLSFAAEALWNDRDVDRRLLLRRTHEESGGVAGALGRHADGVLAALPAHDEDAARTVLLRLVTADRTRRLSPRAEVTAGLDDGGERVVDRLIDARLVTVLSRKGLDHDESMLELVHEALIRHWPTLRRWIEETEGSLTVVRDVEQAATLWDRRGRRDAELWRDPGLAEAERALEHLGDEPAAQARAFVALGRRHERRRMLMRRGTAGLALFASAALALVFWVQNQDLTRSNANVRVEQQRAESEREQSQRRRAEALREGARAAYVGGDILEARAKVRMALEIEDSPEARTLWWQLLGDPQVWATPMPAIPYDVAFSPDGRWVAVAAQDRTVRLFDAETRATRVLRGHGDQVFALAFSPDARSLASGDWGGQILLWDIASGSRRALVEHPGQVSTLAFHPDGHQLAAAGADGVVRLWDATDGALLRALEGHTGAVSELRFDTTGRLLVSASADDSVRVWELPSGEMRTRLEGTVTDVALSADGRYLVTASSESPSSVVEIRSTREGEVVRRLDLAHGHALDVVLSTDGEQLYVATSAHTVETFDVATGSALTHLETQVDLRDLALSSDGERLAVAAHDALQLWDTRVTPRERPLRGHGAPVRGLSFSPDGARLLSGGWDGRALLWDVASGAELASFSRARRVEAVAFSPSGTHFAVASREIGLFETASGLVVSTLDGHAREVMDLDFSADGHALASTSTDMSARVWREASGWSGEILEEDGAGRLRGVSWDPGGRWVAASGDDHLVRVWDAETGQLRRRLTGHTDFVRGLRFTADGRRLVSGGWDRMVRVWDPESGEQTHELGPLPGRVLFLDVHPDGRRVAIPGSDGVVRIWDMDDDRQRILRGHRDEVNFARFSHDGATLATSSDDGTVRLWDTETGEPRWRNEAAPAPVDDGLLERFAGQGVTAVARTADGAVLVGYADGGVGRAADENSAPISIPLELSPASPVTRLTVASLDALLVGYANGEVAMWDLSTGARLERARLHGAIEELTLAEGTLSAGSELGDVLVWDLGFLDRPRCDLLREVWQHVAVVWREGRATGAAADVTHACHD